MLNGKVIFLTGGAGGIGRECALAYVREGAQVAIADVNLRQAMETAAEIGSAAMAVDCDVCSGDSVRLAINAALNRFGRLDAVHNNAGIAGVSQPLHLTAEEDWDTLINVNLKSVYWTSRYALELLRATRGAILNTASAVGLIGQSNHAAYVASKGAMIALTKAMALDYAPYGIRVNALCPAGVWTPMLREWAATQPDPGTAARHLEEIHPLGYCPQGDVIADAAAFLLSEKARFITGGILPVSGGAELGYKR